jgi:hypothetical protein
MMVTESGRVTGSREPSQSSLSRPVGFDPARCLHILQHSLGVDKHGQGRQYRNHFVTGEGSIDYPDCQALVRAGLMVRQKGGRLTGGDDAFFVTDEGRRYVAENSPQPPKLTKSQQRYRDWLKVADCTNETFIEFCRRQAIATEARRAATGNTDAVEDEGAGPKDIAQKAAE